MNFTKRINLVINELMAKGYKKYEIAEAAGYSKGVVRMWENGEAKSINLDGALALERKFGYNHKWLMMVDDEPKIKTSKTFTVSNNDEFEFIKFVEISVNAGFDGFAIDYLDENIYEPLYFKKSWFDKRNYKPEKLYALSVKGESMSPTINEGSVIIINTEDVTTKNDEIYVVNHYGETVVKRLIKDYGLWWLVSDNNDQHKYPRVQCDETTFIVGRVIHSQSEYL